MMKKLIALLTAFLAVLSLFACTAKPADTDAADSDWTYISGKGTLIVGITEYAPMNYYDANGELIGFDTELTRAVCGKLGISPEFQVIEWDSKEIELAGKTIDCIWNGLTVTEERRANMDFTDDYLLNRQAVVVRADTAAAYPDTAAFAGCTVVAEAGSAGADAVLAAMPDANFVEVAAQSDALLEVKAGTADAAVVDVTMALAMVGEGSDYADLKLLDIEMPGERYAVGFRLGSDVTDKVSDAIAALYADGTVAALAEKYGVTDLLIVG